MHSIDSNVLLLKMVQELYDEPCRICFIPLKGRFEELSEKMKKWQKNKNASFCTNFNNENKATTKTNDLNSNPVSISHKQKKRCQNIILIRKILPNINKILKRICICKTWTMGKILEKY